MTAFQTPPQSEIGTARPQLLPIDAPGIAGVRRIIGYLIGANVNQTSTDLPCPLLLAPGQNFVITGFTLNNASTSLTTATMSLYTAAAAGGTAIVSDAAVSALTSSTKHLAMTIASGGTGNIWTNNSTSLGTAGYLYPRVGTAQGAAATVDIWIWGEVYL